MKSGCSSTLKPDTLGLSCKSNKCSDPGAGDLSVLPTHETSLMEMTTAGGLQQTTASPGGDALFYKHEKKYANKYSDDLKKWAGRYIVILGIPPLTEVFDSLSVFTLSNVCLKRHCYMSKA